MRAFIQNGCNGCIERGRRLLNFCNFSFLVNILNKILGSLSSIAISEVDTV